MNSIRINEPVVKCSKEETIHAELSVFDQCINVQFAK